MRDIQITYKHLLMRDEGKPPAPIKVIGWFHLSDNHHIWYGFHGPLWRANSPFASPLKMTFFESEAPSPTGIGRAIRKQRFAKPRTAREERFADCRPEDLLPDFTDQLLNQLAIAKMVGLRSVRVGWDGSMLFVQERS